MKVLDFMNTHDNWEELLAAEPYNIIVKRDGDYVLLKYNQLNADFSNPIVRECRGSIFRLSDGKWICVCHPFDKFGNYGESYVPELDWKTIRVTEKIDGSLIKVWYDRGEWHVSTNGTIDAFKAYIGQEKGDNTLTFGELFKCAVGNRYWNEFLDDLCIYKTYMFELTSSYTQIVIPYDLGVYYLSCRDNTTDKEDFRCYYAFSSPNIDYPEVMKLRTLEDCIAAVAKFDKNREGLVAVDGNGNRVKIKGEEYLMAARVRNNGVVTTRRIVDMVKNEQLDDFLAYCPQYKERVDKILTRMSEIAYYYETQYWKATVELGLTTCREVALSKEIDAKIKDYCYKRLQNKVKDAWEYLLSLWTCKIVELVEENNE